MYKVSVYFVVFLLCILDNIVIAYEPILWHVYYFYLYLVAISKSNQL